MDASLAAPHRRRAPNSFAANAPSIATALITVAAGCGRTELSVPAVTAQSAGVPTAIAASGSSMTAWGLFAAPGGAILIVHEHSGSADTGPEAVALNGEGRALTPPRVLVPGWQEVVWFGISGGFDDAGGMVIASSNSNGCLLVPIDSNAVPTAPPIRFHDGDFGCATHRTTPRGIVVTAADDVALTNVFFSEVDRSGSVLSTTRVQSDPGAVLGGSAQIIGEVLTVEGLSRGPATVLASVPTGTSIRGIATPSGAILAYTALIAAPSTYGVFTFAANCTP